MKTQNKLISQLRYKLVFTLVALFFASTLMAQNFELVKNINPEAGTVISGLTIYDGKLYFSASDVVHGFELWSTDGTTAGTQLLKDIDPGTNSGVNPFGFSGIDYNNNLYFDARYELWTSDGTTAGTQPLVPGLLELLSGFIEYDGKLFFSGYSDGYGEEIWMTDGTASGTQLLKDINPDYRDSDPSDFTKYNGNLYFIAEDDIHGGELWVTDGTASGTHLIKDINPGSDSGMLTIFTGYNGKLYFSAEDDDDNGYELWVTDGTTSGTQMLKDINPGSDDSYPTDLTEYNGKLYFNADDGIHGEELWVTDGTPEGTQLVKDINTGSDDGTRYYYGRRMVEYNGKLYFTATDQTYNNRLGKEPWVTDGTTEGTHLLKDIRPGEPNSNARFYTKYNGRLYFIAEDSSANGSQLWVTDGTPEGTSMEVPDFGSNASALTDTEQFKSFDGSLYFMADYDSNGRELWKLTTDNLSVENYTKNTFVAYPNPVKDVLHLKTTTGAIQKIQLFSITGQRLKSWEGKSEINLNQFAPGSYFVKMTATDNRTVVKQIIKN